MHAEGNKEHFSHKEELISHIGKEGGEGKRVLAVKGTVHLYTNTLVCQ